LDLKEMLWIGFMCLRIKESDGLFLSCGFDKGWGISSAADGRLLSQRGICFIELASSLSVTKIFL